jgi:hypothetical protein
MPLKRAGCDRDLFTSDTVAMIHEAVTGGIRETDLATASLCVAARRNEKLWCTRNSACRFRLEVVVAAPLFQRHRAPVYLVELGELLGSWCPPTRGRVAGTSRQIGPSLLAGFSQKWPQS